MGPTELEGPEGEEERHLESGLAFRPLAGWLATLVSLAPLVIAPTQAETEENRISSRERRELRSARREPWIDRCEFRRDPRHARSP